MYRFEQVPLPRARLAGKCDNRNGEPSCSSSSGSSTVAEEKIADFEATYGSHGPWSKLFARSAEHIGTELLKDAYVPGRYLTVDRWASEEAFRAFRAVHDSDYEALDRGCDSVTASEMRIGAFLA